MKELLETGNSGSLGFNEQYNALVGTVDRLNTVIKENDETKSYGCLIWVRRMDGVAKNELEDYLSQQVAEMPHVIKHFKAMDRGAAIALVKYNDPARNMHNISRFLSDLSEDLFNHGYANCCYSCGKINDLEIYGSGNSVVQYCPECAKGEPVRIDLNAADIERMAYEAAERAVIEAAENSVPDEPEETVDLSELAKMGVEESSIDELFTDGTETPVETKPAEAAEIVEGAKNIEELSDFMVGGEEEAPVAAAAETVEHAENNAELSDFIVDDREEAPVAAAAETVEHAENNAELSDFMVGEDEEASADVGEEASEAYSEEIHTEDSSSGDLSDFGDLLADETSAEADDEAYEEESDEDVFAAIDSKLFGTSAEKKSEEPAFGNANDYVEGPAESSRKSMIEKERELVDNKEVVLEVTELNINGTNRGEDLKFNMQEEEDEEFDPNVEVTELYDDSNEGENFDIEALDGEFNMPTDTSGKQMTASETPLEKDGSVPMVNPTSDFAETKPSPVKDRNAVRAFAYGSYDNANTAEEPVRFDGRPKGYQGSDPRMGDEMGSVSRDYSRQNAASFSNDGKKTRMSEQRVVNRSSIYAKKSGKTITGRAYYGSSNAILGIVASLLFGVIGCAAWAGVGLLLGMSDSSDTVRLIVMSALGALPAVGAFLGYRIGGDCYDVKGVVIASIISIIMDAVGIATVLISENMQKLKEEVGYLISLDKAVNNVLEELSRGIGVQIWASAAVMAVALIVAIVVAKKKI